MLVDLPLKKYPSVEQTAAVLRRADERLSELGSSQVDGEELRHAKSEHLYASITNFYAKEASAMPDGLLRIELQGVRVEDAVFMAVPAEVFVEIGIRLKQNSPHKTFIVGLANGYIGYLPTREAHALGGYEVVSAKCRPESADLLIEKIVDLEERLFTD